MQHEWESGREARCPWCKAIFVICGCCDRGQVYCTPEHRELGRLTTKRRSNARYQASNEGRDDHRDRNREYRARIRSGAGRVTGHPADNLRSDAIVAPAESAPVVTSTPSAMPSIGDNANEYVGETVGGTDTDTRADHAGLPRHRQSDLTAELQRASSRDRDVPGGVRPLYCFVPLLRHSRPVWAVLVLEQTTARSSGTARITGAK